MNNSFSVAVIGLGSMGMGAAKSCIGAGLDVYGVDLNPDALTELQQAGAAGVSNNAADFAAQLDAVLILVVNGEQERRVLFGDSNTPNSRALADKLKPGTAVMCSSTVAVEDAKFIAAELQKRELAMLDAPVSGGAAKAASGDMTVMASGEQAVFDQLQPVLDAVAGKVYRVGDDIGKGTTVKIIHQLLAGVHIAAGAEAMAMAAKADIDLATMYDVVTNAAGNSWMFENRMQHVVDGDYTPLSMVDIFVKDLGLVSDAAKSLKFPTPLAATALSMFTQASNAGYGKEDDSAVIKIFQDINLPTGK